MDVKPRKIPFKELRCEIVRNGLYAKDLANMIHISTAEMSKRLTGKRPWSMREIYAVIEALDLDPQKITFYWPVEDVRMCG